MKLLKTKKRIDFDISIKNIRISTFNYSAPKEDGWDSWTEIHLWYECDCENCPLSWEARSYEGECEDCGCLFDHNFNVPIWKCMLPKWLKNIVLKKRG